MISKLNDKYDKATLKMNIFKSKGFAVRVNVQ